MIPSLLLALAVLAGSAVGQLPTEKELRETYRKASGSADPAARARAVTDYANGTRGLEDDGASKLVARTLADALDDDDIEVRAAAITALSWGRHVDTAIDALGDVLPELRNETEKYATRTGEGDDEYRREVGRLYQQVCVALGRHTDDRAVDALTDELRKQRPGQRDVSNLHVRPLADALLALGSVEAVEAVVKTTAVFSGGSLNRASSNLTARRLHESLSAFSEEVGYGAPEFDDSYEQHWREWLKEHEEELVAKLGKLDEPITAPEYERPDRNPYRRRAGRQERP